MRSSAACVSAALVGIYQDPVEGRGRATSLHVSENSGASVEAEPVSHQLRANSEVKGQFAIVSAHARRGTRPCLFDLVGCDGFAVSGHGSFSHNDHVQTTTSGPLLKYEPILGNPSVKLGEVVSLCR